MAAFLIDQPDSKVKPRYQQVRTARGHPSGHRLNQLAQGGIKPEPQLDHLQERRVSTRAQTRIERRSDQIRAEIREDVHARENQRDRFNDRRIEETNRIHE